MTSRENQISVGALMIAIAVVAILLGVILALREGPLVADPPYVPRPKPPRQRPLLIAGHSDTVQATPGHHARPLDVKLG